MQLIYWAAENPKKEVPEKLIQSEFLRNLREPGNILWHSKSLRTW